MIGTLILTHGGLADELLEAAEVISGPAAAVRALCLEWDDSLEAAMEKTRAVCEEMLADDGLLILTDIYGGTPHNVAKALAEPGRIEVVTGVNLPMVVRLCCREGDEVSVTELATWISAKGQRSICRATPGSTCE